MRAHQVKERPSGLAAKVVSTEFLGSDSLIRLTSPAGELSMRGAAEYTPGQPITVDFAQFHLFDPDTGEALHHSK